jgi:hypothetical protein
MNDLTIIYITANKIDESFAERVRAELKKAAGNIPIVSVSKKPLNFEVNLCFSGKASVYNEYKETYLGAREAKTKYIAIAEDDSLYSPAHFAHTPRPDTFEFNISCWGIYTWIKPPVYSMKYKRRNHNALICERDLYVKTMEERFAKYPDPKNYPTQVFAEPGRYEKQLGVTTHKSDVFTTNPPIIRFSHEEDCYGWKAMGKRKKLGDIQAYDIPYWGRTTDLLARIYGKI